MTDLIVKMKKKKLSTKLKVKKCLSTAKMLRAILSPKSYFEKYFIFLASDLL